MGKKNKGGANLGRTLIKDKFGRKNMRGSSMLHTSELQDGQNYGRLMKSITDNSQIEDFALKAELAGTDFTAEKSNIRLVKPKERIGILSVTEIEEIKEAQEENYSSLKVLRRPHWDKSTSAEALAKLEHEAYLQWRTSLSALENKSHLILTPYEHNIEFWRQLWRVIEKSDVVVQIVDARDPLMFFCEDLVKYVKEVSFMKMNLLLLNKADFLTENQMTEWVKYFNQKGIDVVFYSALQEEEEEEPVSNESEISVVVEEPFDISSCLNSPVISRASQLSRLFECLHNGPKQNEKFSTVGLVGYPNVGKSSTINSLMKAKKVSVSVTPGKTKHFQTMHLTENLVLCDCPGLVFPAFVSTKEKMVISGILPVDQMRDYIGPINQVLALIPRKILELTYGISLPSPGVMDDPNRSPTCEELLTTYGVARGFMTHKGVAVQSSSARCILKDFINGELLYCHGPPGVDQDTYFTPRVIKARKLNLRTQVANEKNIQKETSNNLPKNNSFFRGHSANISRKTEQMSLEDRQNGTVTEKPWRHQHKQKRVKSRIRYAHLDN